MCGSPARPNTAPSESDNVEIGSESSVPGPMILIPALCAATAFAASVSKLKPNCPNASIPSTVPPNSSRTALMICTQVVAIMPPNAT